MVVHDLPTTIHERVGRRRVPATDEWLSVWGSSVSHEIVREYCDVAVVVNARRDDLVAVELHQTLDRREIRGHRLDAVYAPFISRIEIGDIGSE